jgi:hypothetical protein
MRAMEKNQIYPKKKGGIQLYREFIILFSNASSLQLNQYVYGRLLIYLNCFQIFDVVTLFPHFHVK